MAISPDLLKGTIITSRIRLARNINGYPFSIENKEEAQNIVKGVYRALSHVDSFNLYYMEKLSDIKLECMKERHLISQELIDNKEKGAALVSQDSSLSIMVNEEDVIREQCFFPGLRLQEAYKKLLVIDNELEKNIDFAYDEDFGYLTACPTNLGTGMRASVMMFLPALTEAGRINDLIYEMKQMGLTVRGLYGEGSLAEGYMYQISNEVTLGVSELDIINNMEEAINSICQAERDYMKTLYSKQRIKVMDRAKKSFGILTNAVLLSYSEFLSHIANVKIGAIMGLIGITDIEEIDNLIVAVRPASLCEQYGKNLSSTDRDLFRAEFVASRLLSIKE